MSIRIYIETNTADSWEDLTHRFNLNRPGSIGFSVSTKGGNAVLSPPKSLSGQNGDGWWLSEPLRAGSVFLGEWGGRRVKITLEEGGGKAEVILGIFRVKRESGVVISDAGVVTITLESLAEKMRSADASDFSYGKGWHTQIPWVTALDGIRKPEDDTSIDFPSAMIELQGVDRVCSSCGIPGDFQDDGFHEIRARAVDVVYNETDDRFCYATQEALYEYDPDTGLYDEVSLTFSIPTGYDIFRIWWRKGTGAYDGFYYVLIAMPERADQYSPLQASGYYQPTDQKAEVTGGTALYASNYGSPLAVISDIQLAPVVYRPNTGLGQSDADTVVTGTGGAWKWVVRWGGETIYGAPRWQRNENVPIPFAQYPFLLVWRRMESGDVGVYNPEWYGLTIDVTVKRMQETTSLMALASTTIDTDGSWPIAQDGAFPAGQQFNDNDLRAGRGYYQFRNDFSNNPGNWPSHPVSYYIQGGLRFSMGNGPMISLSYSTDTWFTVSPRTCWICWTKFDTATDRWWVITSMVPGDTPRTYSGNGLDDATYGRTIALSQHMVPTFVKCLILGYADRHGGIVFGWHDFYGDDQGGTWSASYLTNRAGVGFYPCSIVAANGRVTFDANGQTDAIVFSDIAYSGALVNEIYSSGDDYMGAWTPVSCGIYQYQSGARTVYWLSLFCLDRQECGFSLKERRMGVPYRMVRMSLSYDEYTNAVAAATFGPVKWRGSLPPMGVTDRLDGIDHGDTADSLYCYSPSDHAIVEIVQGSNTMNRLDSIPQTEQWMGHGILAVGGGGGVNDPFVAGVTSPVFPFTGKERWPAGEYQGWIYGEKHTGRIPLLDLSEMSKWEGMKYIAEVGNSVVYFDRVGDLILRTYPEAGATPDMILETGDWGKGYRVNLPIVNHATRSLGDVVPGSAKVSVTLSPFSEWNLAPGFTGFGSWPIDLELKCIQGGLCSSAGPWGKPGIGQTLWAFRVTRKSVHTVLESDVSVGATSVTVSEIEEIEVGDLVTLSTADEDIEISAVNYDTGVLTVPALAKAYDAGADIWVGKRGDGRWSWERSGAEGTANSTQGVAVVEDAASAGDNRVRVSGSEMIGVGNLVSFEPATLETPGYLYLVKRVYPRWSVDEGIGDRSDVWIEVDYIDADGSYDPSGSSGLQAAVSVGAQVYCLLSLPPGNRKVRVGGTGVLFSAVGEGSTATEDEEKPAVEGDRIKVSYPGLTIQKNSLSKVTARNADSLAIYGKKTPRGMKPNRFMDRHIANQNVKRTVAMGADPRVKIVLKGVTHPDAHEREPWDVIRIMDYDMLRDKTSTAPLYSADGVVTGISTDLATGLPDITCEELVDPGGADARPISSDLPDELVRLFAGWWKADEITGYSDGDQLDEWEDSTKFGNDATATMTTRPLYKTDIQAHLPAVLFDGSNDKMIVGDVETHTSGVMGAGNPGWTIFCAGELDGTKTFLNSMVSKFNVAAGMSMFIRDNMFSIQDNPAIFTAGEQITTAAVFDTPMCMCLTGAPSTTCKIYRNNVLVGTAGTAAGAAILDGPANLCLGGEDWGTFFLKGYLYEVIIIPRLLSNQDRTTIANYIGLKWDL